MEFVLTCALRATLITGGISLAFAIGMLIPVLKGILYWLSMIPLMFLYVAGFKVGTLLNGFLVPNGFGYFVLAMAIWVVTFGLTLIIKRE